MMLLPEAVRIFVATEPVDMRKSFEGLCQLARTVVGQDPLSGHLFLFLNRAATHVKILMWTRGGFTIVYKRLEQGQFRFASRIDRGVKSVEIDVAELSMLLEGLDVSKAKSSRRWQRERANKSTSVN